jgi:protein TonB
MFNTLESTWDRSARRSAPPAAAQAPPDTVERPRTPRSTNIAGEHVIAPPSIPRGIAILNEQPVAAAPNIDDGVQGGTDVSRRGRGIWGPIGNNPVVAPPPPTPAPTRHIIVSRWAEGNLIYRVQPIYPPLARQARIQGTVQLRAIISKTGTIENLVAVSGHPMLVPAALNAVRQWRYRPFLLNSAPIDVETEITVNFVLSEN